MLSSQSSPAVDSQILTLERGKRMTSPIVDIGDLKKMVRHCQKTNQPMEKVIEELIQATDGYDHSGIFRSVIFRTDQPISLHSLGFWGPQKVDEAEYGVNIIISELSSLTVKGQTKMVVSRFHCLSRGAKKGDVFVVPLNHPVTVRAGGWIQIEFELKGPPTFRSEKMLSECKGPGGVNFFFSDSSRQMPIMKYTIL